MSTPLTDLLTAAKNIVTAIGNLSTQYLNVQGATNTAGIASSTVVKQSAGRLCSISVTTAGSAPGVAYDAASAGLTTRPLCAIPNTVGVFVINLPTNYGLVIVPGTGQVVTVSWS